jgi:N-6 DNA Methylase
MKRVTRHKSSTLNLPTLRLEGGLFLPDVLEKAALGTARMQADADYGIPKGLKQKDEYSRAFQIASAQWKHFEKQMERVDLDAAHATATFVTELLRDTLAYPAVGASTGISVGERHYPVTHIASNGLGAQLPIVVAPHTQGLDEADARFGVRHSDSHGIGGHSGTRKKSPFQLAQELLNASPDHQWAIVTNGKTIRLLRDAATLTRPSYLDIDMADLLSSQRYAEFAYAWRLLHASRAGLQATSDSQAHAPVVWEAWREAGQEEGTRVRNGLRLGVTQALLTFGNGFLQHPANDALRLALQNGELSKEAYFAQLLRLIYRLIFVFSIEERGLLKDANGQTNVAYTQGYALARLRDMALRRRARNRFDDLWQSMRIVFKGLNQGEPRLGLPALGGLFNTSQCPALESAELSNAYLLATMQSMRWAAQAGGSLAPIDYRNMGVEELGSVYESLLELVPEVDLPARTFGFVGLTSEGSTAGNERKLTGSYYTPDSLVQELIQSALAPVIDQRIAAQPDNPVEALLSIKVCDPACGSGHFLLAAARKLAERLAALRSDDGVVTPSAYRHALREVIARCIYGVDRNPMAIELARTALWLEGFEEGRPLTFLDHHLQVGDALLGLTDLNVLEHGIGKDAYKPLAGDDKETCKALAKNNALAVKQLQREVDSGQLTLQFADDKGLNALKTLESMPADTPEQVQAKEDAYQTFLAQAVDSTMAHAADLYAAAFILPKTPDTQAAVPTTETLIHELSPHPKSEKHQAMVHAANAACQAAKVFHWPLAFPQVFAAGGFDCVLANPPWEVSQMGEEEFFAARAADIASLQGDQRKQAIKALEKTNPMLWREYQEASHRIAATNVFYRESGRFALTAVGKLNTYPLFSETILQIKSASGRAGFIVPTGIATDDSTKLFFGHISQSGQLASLYDIENKEALFDSVHRSFKFSLLTLGQSPVAEFVCFASQPSQLTDTRRRFSLTPHEFQLINPNTLTCPMFRSERDAELTKKLYRSAPVLIKEAVYIEEGSKRKLVSPEINPWGIRFSQGLFNMTSDSALFKFEPSEHRYPLYEAKLIHQFDHRFATFIPTANMANADWPSRDVTLDEKSNPHHAVTPRYWVDKREVWLQVARLPEGLLKALKERHAPGIVLMTAWMLFGDWLRKHHGQGVYPAWQAFAKQHPFAHTLSPVSMGLCVDNPACLKPLNDNYLPGQPRAEVDAANERQQPAWFLVDDASLASMLQAMQTYAPLLESTPVLQTVDEVLEFAEGCLETASSSWLMGWRNIARATDERSFISTVMPLSSVGHSMPLWSLDTTPQLAAAFLANMSALVYDYCVRQKLGGTNMTFGYFKQFPTLPPDRYTEADLAYIVPRVLELTYTAHDLAAWSQELGHSGPPFPFNPERRAQLRAELDAYYARLYGLTRDELRYILDPADVMGNDYPSETFRVLKNGELREFGEYRTQRLVLAAWDQLSAGVLK